MSTEHFDGKTTQAMSRIVFKPIQMDGVLLEPDDLPLSSQMTVNAKLLLVGTCAIGASLLSGCMALAIAPLAASVGSMANGARENIIQVTIDEKTFTPEVRTAFLNAKSLAIVAGDRSDIKAADLFETRGGYQVTIDRPTAKVGEMTGSERRDVLRKLCANPQRPDLAMMGRVTRTETGNKKWLGSSEQHFPKDKWALRRVSAHGNALGS